jgi:hypothetical protein
MGFKAESGLSVLRAELRQTFIDPVDSPLYYQANFGGLTASINIAVEGPFSGGRKAEPAVQPVQPQYSTFSDNEYYAINNHLDNIDSYYYQSNWNRMVYQPWNAPVAYISLIQPTQQQIDEQKAQEEKARIEQEQKQQDYIQQKLQLRQEKKDTLNPAR